MATLGRGQTFGATETITNTKLHALVDSGTVSGIVSADCAANMALADTKLDDITTGNKVSGSSLFNLASTPGASGQLPRENISLASIPAIDLINLASVPTDQGIFNHQAVVSSLASGIPVGYGGGDNLVPIEELKTLNLINLASVPTNQGVFNYQSVVSSLASGAIVGYGGGDNLVPTSAGIKLKSNTTGSGATNTGNITLETDKRYLITFDIVSDDNNQIDLYLGFNGGTDEQLAVGGAGGTKKAAFWGEIHLSTDDSFENYKAMFTAHLNYINTSDNLASTSVQGAWTDGSAVTSFRLVDDNGNNITYKVRLYELDQ